MRIKFLGLVLAFLAVGCGSDQDIETPSELASLPSTIAISKSLVGNAYWWGHALPATGKMPKCNRFDSRQIGGLDCSGFVAKVWGLANPIGRDYHPYSTYDFFYSSKLWQGKKRDGIKKGDAFVRRSNGKGHIFIFDNGNPWGKAWAYEARGCDYGVLYNLRNITSDYQGRSLR
jgi:cell wall-associated NlpC family hydrolase